MSNGENEGKTLKMLVIIILVITAITLVYLFIHDRRVTNNAVEPADESQTSTSVSAVSAVINQQPVQAMANTHIAKMRGIANGYAKHLRLDDEGSPTVDVSLASETDITISGWNEFVMVQFGNSPEAKTVDMAGLVPGKTYHIYKNGLTDHQTAVATTSGELSVSLSGNDYSLIVQPQPSTIVINSPTGGDCSTVGTWSEGVCTLSKDVNETIVINSSNVTLDCAGYGVKTADPDSIFFGIYNAGVPPGAGGPSNTNTVIKNCTIDANVAFGMLVLFADEVVIESNTVYNAGLFGIYLYFVTNAVVEANDILEFSGQGIFSFWSSNVDIKGNTLVSSAYIPANPNLPWYSSIQAINTPRTYGGEISGNEITLSAPASANVLLSGISGWLFGNLLIDDNVISLDSGIVRDRRDNIRPSQGGFGAAITMDGASDLIITNNRITTTGASGVTMANGSGFDNPRITIRGNTISGAVMPIYVLRSTGSTVEKNTISRSGSIVLAAGSGNTVKGNLIENGVNWGETYRCMIGVSEPSGNPEYPKGLFPASCDQLSGIVLMAGETGSIITGNTIRNMPGAGILIEETVTSEVDGSGIWPFDPDLSTSITMSPTQNNAITRNSITSNLGSGIKLLKSSDNIFSLNDITGNASPQVISDTRVFVDYNGFDELKGLGNYWGINCPAGAFFVPGVQSNSADVLDRKPFGYPVAELSYIPTAAERPCQKK